MIFLDTNIGVYFGKRASPALEQRLQAAVDGKSELVISPITLHELELGVYRSHNPVTKRLRLEKFLGLVQRVVPFDAEDAVWAAEIRSDLMKKGSAIGSYDLLIAAQVLRRGASLITHNVGEFSRVPGLHWEDWTAA